jgi:hypothetical protein
VQHVLNDATTFSKDLLDYTILGGTVGDSILTTAGPMQARGDEAIL